MRQFFFILYFSLSVVGLWAQDIPEPMSPKRLVNDYVGMLNATERETLEQKLRAYNDSTSSQITVVVVKTTGNYPAGDYAFELGRRWGVGQKDKDNGLVLLWATQDRKIFIATGRGLEGAIPDVIAKRIIREVITPEFKAELYYRGLDHGTDEIIKYASGEYNADSSDDGGLFMAFIMIAVIIIIIIIAMSTKSGGGDGDGGSGTYTTYSSWGSSSGSSSSSSSSSSFGGFGGGDFGGGGAGGDY